MKVLKFGGSSVSTPDNILKVKEIIETLILLSDPKYKVEGKTSTRIRTPLGDLAQAIAVQSDETLNNLEELLLAEENTNANPRTDALFDPTHFIKDFFAFEDYYQKLREEEEKTWGTLLL